MTPASTTRLLPLFPQQRTGLVAPWRMALCAKRSLMRCSESASLFDYLVGHCKQCGRHLETECPGGLDVDRQLKLCGRLCWKIGRSGPLQNAVDISCRAPRDIRDVGA